MKRLWLVGAGLALVCSATAAEGRSGWFVRETPLTESSYAKACERMALHFGPKAFLGSGPGNVTAYAGSTLARKQDQGRQTVRWAYPVNTATQEVDPAGPKLEVVDSETGKVLDCILESHLAPMPESKLRPQLQVTFDLSRMAKVSLFRYSVQVKVSDKSMALDQPIALPLTGDFPAEARGYLNDEPNVEVRAPQVRAMARELRKHSKTLQELIVNTRVAMHKLPQTGSFAFDAVGFLTGGNGSCTSNAHLFAALMRANGVPCRPITGILRGMGQDMHWENEYWVPGQGWAHVEPQVWGRMFVGAQTPRSWMVETGPVEPSFDRSRTEMYFEAFFGQPIDDAGREMKPEQALLRSWGGLLVNPEQETSPHYFGA